MPAVPTDSPVRKSMDVDIKQRMRACTSVQQVLGWLFYLCLQKNDLSTCTLTDCPMFLCLKSESAATPGAAMTHPARPLSQYLSVSHPC